MTRPSISKVITQLRDHRVHQLGFALKMYNTVGMDVEARSVQQEIERIKQLTELGNVFEIREIQVARKLK